MNNGCICCTVRGDLIRILKNLKKHSKKFDYVLIETTGLADPAPVAQTFFVDDDICAAYELDGIITVVDAKHVLQHLDEVKPDGVENESVEQVAFADRILINKIDLVPEEELKILEGKVRGINSSAPMIRTQNSEIDLEKILNIKAFDLKKITEMDPEFLTDQEHQHDTSVSSVGMRFEGAIDMLALNNFISELMQSKGVDLFRYKGILSIIGAPKKYVFQGVHMLWGGTFSDGWTDEEKRENIGVFIGRNLDREKITTGFMGCIAKPLRFQVGTKVLANVGKGANAWKKGTVIKQWDETAAYRIQLDDGKKTEVWAPIDDDVCVKPDTE